jgi:hypothetical protein
MLQESGDLVGANLPVCRQKEDPFSPGAGVQGLQCLGHPAVGGVVQGAELGMTSLELVQDTRGLVPAAIVTDQDLE